MQSNRRQFLASIVALFGVRKTTVPLPVGVYLQRPIFEDPWNQPYTVKPRSLGITTTTQQLMEEHYSRVLSYACGEPLEFKFDLSKAENNV